MPSTRVVKFDAVRDALPADAAVVTHEERAAELVARQAHIATRFRV